MEIGASVRKVHTDKLPARFSNWVEFYDSVLSAISLNPECLYVFLLEIEVARYTRTEWQYIYEVSHIKEMALAELMESRLTHKEAHRFRRFFYSIRANSMIATDITTFAGIGIDKLLSYPKPD